MSEQTTTNPEESPSKDNSLSSTLLEIVSKENTVGGIVLRLFQQSPNSTIELLDGTINLKMPAIGYEVLSSQFFGFLHKETGDLTVVNVNTFSRGESQHGPVMDWFLKEGKEVTGFSLGEEENPNGD